MTVRVTDVASDTFRDLTRERRWLGELDGDILQTQVEVSQIAAPTGSEQRRAGWIARRLAGIRPRARVGEAGNVGAHAPGAGARAPGGACAPPRTLFPMETTPTPRRDGDRLRGPRSW